MSAGEFDIAQVWSAVQSLLSSQLDNNVDVDCIGAKDFDEQGELTLILPAARVLFEEEVPSDPLETQNTVYNTSQMFAVLCADEDLGANPQDQRLKSAALAGKVKHILIGARLVINDAGEQSEPVVYKGTSPLPTAEGRLAYMARFSVDGIAQFAAPNATPEVQ